MYGYDRYYRQCISADKNWAVTMRAQKNQNWQIRMQTIDDVDLTYAPALSSYVLLVQLVVNYLRHCYGILPIVAVSKVPVDSY